MYVMNNDFFDGFTVSFAGSEVMVNGSWYPLGSFTVEYLNLDRRILRQAEQQLPVLKEALTVFLSARDASSAAYAQQALIALWDTLMQLPVCSLFARADMSHHHLLRYLREHPEETDDMLTLGTQRHDMYQQWLARLEQLPGSIETFIRDTVFFVEEYLERLTVRKASAYAAAYARYRQEARTQFEIELEAQKETGSLEPVPHIAIEFPTRLSYRTIQDPKKKGGFLLAESMIFKDLSVFLHVELCRAIMAGSIPRRCQSCGHYFLLSSGYDIRYCTGIAPGETARTCRQVGAHRKEKEKNGSDFIHREYARLYNRLKARKNKGVISVDKWNSLVARALDLKELAIQGKLSDAELKQRYDGM